MTPAPVELASDGQSMAPAQPSPTLHAAPDLGSPPPTAVHSPAVNVLATTEVAGQLATPPHDSEWDDAEEDGVPSDARISRYAEDDDWFEEARFSAATPRRTQALRWLVFLVVLGLFGMAVATLGRKYAGHFAKYMSPPTTDSSPSGQARARQLLEEGEAALADGDLESAKESFDKASVIDEHDARALLDLARLAAIRADLDWLKVRLLPNDQALLISATKRQLSDSAQRAWKAIERAVAVDADNPHVVLAKVDALRIAGDLAGARSLVVSLGAIAQQPETAFALAALDLDEPTPDLATVLDRLKTAASAEGALMRARGVYVYALVRAGLISEARIELERIIASTRPHPLLAELRAFVGRAIPSTTDGAASAQESDPSKREGAPARPGEQVARSRESIPAGGGATDYRTLLRQAGKAFAGREFARAEGLYRSALMAHPGDTEAISGLGDCARARGNRQLAVSHYEEVLAHNPSYLPAVNSLADLRWESGDRAGASGLYRRVIELAPSSASANRAKERLAELDRGTSPATASPSPGSPTHPAESDLAARREPSPVPDRSVTSPSVTHPESNAHHDSAPSTEAKPGSETPGSPETGGRADEGSRRTTRTGSTLPPGVDTSDLPGVAP